MSQRPTVVIAESDENFLVYLSTLLGRMNFEVIPCNDCHESYDLAKVVKPNLLFHEETKNNPIGLEVVRRIRADKELNGIPIVMIGGQDSDIEACFAAGCSDFLTKPLGLTFLHLAVQKCFPDRQNMRKHLRAPFNKKITYECQGKTEQCFAVTLSEGGVYVRTRKPLPVGTKLKLKIPLESEAEICLFGTVIYQKGLSRGRFLIPPGMAVRFCEDESESNAMKSVKNAVCNLLIGDIFEEQEHLSITFENDGPKDH